MSFSSGVKAELCRQNVTGKSCAIAQCYGILLYCNTFSASCIRIITESRELAELLPRLFKKAFGVEFNTIPEADATGKLQFELTGQESIRKIYQSFGFSAADNVTLHVNFGILEDDAERLAFVRGAFLAGGSVTDPAKRYHLELATSHLQASREVSALLLDMGFSPKQTLRAGTSILYFKQSDSIEDFLTAIGASVSAMGVMEAKVEKELRNGVNRRVNCETANLDKAVDASMEQIAAIRRLQSRGDWETLSPKLKQVAALRLDNPEATLTELAELLDPPLTKSAVNHRLRKLMELARE